MKLLVVQSLHHHLKSAEQGFFPFHLLAIVVWSLCLHWHFLGNFARNVVFVASIALTQISIQQSPQL